MTVHLVHEAPACIPDLPTQKKNTHDLFFTSYPSLCIISISPSLISFNQFLLSLEPCPLSSYISDASIRKPDQSAVHIEVIRMHFVV